MDSNWRESNDENDRSIDDEKYGRRNKKIERTLTHYCSLYICDTYTRAITLKSQLYD
jgi:hypothetical protein